MEPFLWPPSLIQPGSMVDDCRLNSNNEETLWSQLFQIEMSFYELLWRPPECDNYIQVRLRRAFCGIASMKPQMPFNGCLEGAQRTVRTELNITES